MPEQKQVLKQDDGSLKDGKPSLTAIIKAHEEDLPAGYRRTEVGIIPNDWECASIQHVARLESGHTPSKRKPNYWGGGIPWVSLHDTDSLDQENIFFTAQTITEEGLANSSARLLPAGTVIFSRTATVGKATILGRKMATSQDFANYICGSRLHNHFLVHLFRSMGKRWQSYMAGSTHNTIYMPVFKFLKIPLPSFEEQRAIATALSDADAFIESLDRLIAKKRAIKQAAMQQLLTGQTRLPGFEGQWETRSLGDIGTFYKGQGIKRDDISDEGVPCIRYGELYTRYINYILAPVSRILPSVAQTAFPLKKGDLLLAGSGETAEEIGQCAAYLGDQQAYAGGDIVVLRPDTHNSAYLGHLMNHQTVVTQKSRLGQGDAVVHISARNLAQVQIKLPPLREQDAIVTLLSDMDVEIEALERRRDKTKDIKQGMMQQLLTGRARLVEREIAA